MTGVWVLWKGVFRTIWNYIF